MIPHYPILSSVGRITRIAVHDVMWMDVGIIFCHHQECGNSRFSTSTCGKTVDVQFLVVQDGFYECFRLARHDGILSKSIHPFGIKISWIM